VALGWEWVRRFPDNQGFSRSEHLVSEGKRSRFFRIPLNLRSTRTAKIFRVVADTSYEQPTQGDIRALLCRKGLAR
jgi:hypothetical protein